MVFFISTTPVSILFFAMMEVLSANEDNNMLTSTASLLNFSQSLGPFFLLGTLFYLMLVSWLLVQVASFLNFSAFLMTCRWKMLNNVWKL